MSLLLVPSANGIRQDWTPIVRQDSNGNQSAALGLTVNWARWGTLGNLVAATFRVTLTTSGTAARLIRVSLPVPAAALDGADLARLGDGYIYRSVPATKYEWTAQADTNIAGASNPPTEFTLLRPTDASALAQLGTAGITAQLVSGDWIMGRLLYEPA